MIELGDGNIDDPPGQALSRRAGVPAKASRLRSMYWLAMIIALFFLLIFNLHLSSKLSPLVQKRNQLRVARQKQVSTIQAAPEKQASVRERDEQINRESRPILSRLAHVRELDDFCCFGGDQILATQVLDRNKGYSIFFYVPAGNHRLAYCQYTSDTQQILLGSKHYDRRDANYTTIELQEKTHYQIRFSPGRVSSRSNPPADRYYFTLTSQAGSIATNEVELNFRPISFAVRSQVRCYPSQLTSRLSQDHQSHVLASVAEAIQTGRPRLPVEIAIADYRGAGIQSVLRFLIASDDAPNISCGDFGTFAKSIQQLTGDTSIQAMRQSLFQNYDGSGRYKFRQDFLDQKARPAVPIGN